MQTEDEIELHLGDVLVDFSSDGNIVVKCYDQAQQRVLLFLVRRRGSVWIMDRNVIAMDDLPEFPSVLSH